MADTDGLVDAWLPDGTHRRVPAHWIDHPVLRTGWSTTRPAEAGGPDCCGAAAEEDDGEDDGI